MQCPQDSVTGRFRLVHGLAACKDPAYIAWKAIRRRCCVETTQDYKYYGARGIRLWGYWQTHPQAFVDYVRKNLGMRPSSEYSIDRINNNGDYRPGNLRWATKLQQQNNKRTNRLITYRGQTETLQEWERITGIKRATIRWRLVTGKPLDVVFDKADHR